VDVPVELAEALLPEAVHVVREGEAGLLDRLEDLVQARLDDLGDIAPGDPVGDVLADRGDLHDLIGIDLDLSIIGGLVGYTLIAGLDTPATLLGFIRANPPSGQPYLGIFGGALAIVASFAVSSVPGSILGYVALLAIRRAGIR